MSFADALQFTLAQEGGWYDGSATFDPNPTMQGVTQRTYDAFRDRKQLPRRTVREIERWELETIYHGYWEQVDGDDLPPKTAIAVFDMAVNAGPIPALKLLQQALRVTADGIVGSETRAALAAAQDSALAHRFNTERLKFYTKLTRRNPKLLPALVAWVNRVTSFADSVLTD